MKKSPSFILLAEVRTGGTVLADSLTNHTRLKVLGEVFNVGQYEDWKAWRRSIIQQLYSSTHEIGPSDDFAPILNYIFEHFSGFLLHRQSQIAEGNPSWMYMASLTNIKIIHLYRENLFLQYFSERLAISTEIWHLRCSNEQSRPEWAPITIDVKHCLSTMQERMKSFHLMRYLFARHSNITIRYEEIEADINRVLDYCQGFLEVPLERLPGQSAQTYKQKASRSDRQL